MPSFSPYFQESETIQSQLTLIDVSLNWLKELNLSETTTQELFEKTAMMSTYYEAFFQKSPLSKTNTERLVSGKVKLTDSHSQYKRLQAYHWAIQQLYYQPLATEITIEELQNLHSQSQHAQQSGAPYRNGASAIIDPITNEPSYFPAEHTKIHSYLIDWVEWTNQQLKAKQLHPVVIMAIAHYQWIHIQPYFNDNGSAESVARLLPYYFFKKIGLKFAFFCCFSDYWHKHEEESLKVLRKGSYGSYELDLNQINLTEWIEYYCQAISSSLALASIQVLHVSKSTGQHKKVVLKSLDDKQRKVLSLFSKSRFVTTKEMADLLGVHRRTALNYCQEWLKQGFIVSHGEALKSKKYELGVNYQDLI